MVSIVRGGTTLTWWTSAAPIVVESFPKKNVKALTVSWLNGHEATASQTGQLQGLRSWKVSNQNKGESMSHLLATSNPEAAAQADSGWKPGPELIREEAPAPIPQPRSDLPLPGVGNWVVYHLRSGDSRNRRTFFPALVMAADEEAGTLMLWVVVDDGDTWMREHVRARAEPEDGWELVRPIVQQMMVPKGFDASADSWNDTRQSPQVSPAPDLVAMIVELSDRLAAIEAKRGPGRPPKTKGE